MTALTLTEVVKNIRDLPALPVVVIELLSTLENENTSTRVLAGKVSHDQALTAKTLRLANSSFYGMPSKVTSIQQAIAILGYDSVRALVIAASVNGTFSGSMHATFQFQAFWRHSVATALCAKSLARQLRANEDHAFMLGLLHDIGRLVLVTRTPRHYEEVLAHQKEQDCYLIEAERAVLGLDHAMVGRALAEYWKFPVLMQKAIETHHAPELQGAGSLACIVHIADCITHAMDLSADERDLVPPVSTLAWNGLNLDQEALTRVYRETDMQFEEACQIFLSPT